MIVLVPHGHPLEEKKECSCANGAGPAIRELAHILTIYFEEQTAKRQSWMEKAAEEIQKIKVSPVL